MEPLALQSPPARLAVPVWCQSAQHGQLHAAGASCSRSRAASASVNGLEEEEDEERAIQYKLRHLQRFTRPPEAESHRPLMNVPHLLFLCCSRVATLAAAHLNHGQKSEDEGEGGGEHRRHAIAVNN